MNDPIHESPILHFNGRSAVSFRGRMMFHSTAGRINEYRSHLRRLAEQGMCHAEAARKLGWSVTTIKRWSLILGIPFPKKRNRKVRVHDKTGWGEVITAEARAGGTMGRAAARLGVPIVNIHRWCVDNGVNWKQLKHDAKESNR